jgi:erythritol transport system substrate-binding protein
MSVREDSHVKSALQVGLVIMGTVAAAVACSAPRPKLIAIVTPSPDDPMFSAEADAAASRARVLGYDVMVESHDDDAQKQGGLVDAAIAKRVAALILDPALGNATTAAVAKAKAAGVPVFIIGRAIGAGVATAQIVSGESHCAEDGARVFARLMSEQGDYLELVGKDGDPRAAVRSRGYHDVLDHLPSLKMAGRETANWNRDEAVQRIGTMIEGHRDIKGVIAANDEMALGAVQALEAAGLSNIIIVGFGGSPDAFGAIKTGKLKATMLQPVTLMARTAVDEAHRFLSSGSTGVPENQSVDCDVITRANVESSWRATWEDHVKDKKK